MPDDKLIHDFLYFSPAIFLRPREYLASRVEGKLLVTRNAKATNGRANGEERSRELDLPPHSVARLIAFFEGLSEAASAAGGTMSRPGAGSMMAGSRRGAHGGG